MKRKRTAVSREVKASIISESFEGNCSIKDLAKQYKLSTTTIYRWRRTKKNIKRQEQQENTQFIELHPITVSTTCTLKKVELIFDDYRCCLEGKMNSNQLIKLIQLLEERVC